MPTSKFYSGQIKRASYDNHRILGLKDNETDTIIPFVQFLSTDVLLHGDYVTIHYYFSGKPVRKENILPHMYSYIAGYMRVDSHLVTVDNVDLYDLLEQYIGSFAYMNISFSHVPLFR